MRLGGGKMRSRLNKTIDPILEEEFKPKRLALRSKSPTPEKKQERKEDKDHKKDKNDKKEKKDHHREHKDKDSKKHRKRSYSQENDKRKQVKMEEDQQ